MEDNVIVEEFVVDVIVGGFGGENIFEVIVVEEIEFFEVFVKKM